MIRRFAVCLLIAAFALVESGAISRAQQTPQILHNHVRPAVSDGKVALVGHMDSTQRLHMGIILPLRNKSALEALLAQLYDPASPNYRQFLSAAQFAQQFGPTAEDYQSVADFATANGFTVEPAPPNRLFVDIDGTVSQVENAFHVSMNLYQHPTENRNFFSPDREPSLDLTTPVAHIAGLDSYSIPQPALTKKSTSAQATGSGPYSFFIPSDMRAAYYGAGSLTGSGQCVGLAEFGGYLIGDVTSTLAPPGGPNTATSSQNGTTYTITYTTGGVQYSIPVTNPSFTGYQAVGDTGDAGEQALDIAQAIGMAPGLSQVRVYTAPSDFVGSGNYTYPAGSPSYDWDIFNAMATDTVARCSQLSLSWHWEPTNANESPDEGIFEEFQAQGQSFFAASGDWGAFPTPTDYYYPAESANVAVVGGTDLTTSGEGGSWDGETAWDFSSGGISPDQIQIPGYQQLSGVINSANEGSTAYRNVPDVAMEANFDNYFCDQGVCIPNPSCPPGNSGCAVGGTSYATPRWAGYTALINQQALANGEPPVGFLNPYIYRIGVGPNYSSDFHEITSGNNYCFDVDNVINLSCGQTVYYSAVAGYNLVTGWGSPNGQGLMNALTGFIISASPNIISVAAGSSGSTTISTAVPGVFDANIVLAPGSLPSGISVHFSSTTIAKPGSGSSTMTVNVASTVAPGTYTFAVTGTGGGMAQTVNVTVNVPGFTLSASGFAAVWAGGPATTFSITSTIAGGFDASVTVTTSNAPAGVSINIPPALGAPGSGTCTMTISALATVPGGDYTITVTGTGGGVTSSTIFQLFVENFSISAAPSSLSVAPGSSGTSTITNNMSTGPGETSVSLAESGQPAGVTIGFNPTSLSPTSGTSTMTVTVPSTTTPGTYAITVTGTANGTTISRATTVTLTVLGSFTLSTPPPGFSTLMAGKSTTFPITSTIAGGFSAPVTCTASNVPTGVTINFSPSPIPAPGSGTCTANITAASTAPGGEYAITVTGTGGGVTSSTTFYLYVENISISASPAALSVSPGGNGTSTITLNMTPAPNDSTVTPVATGQPTGVTVSFNPTYLVPTSGTSTMTLAVASTTTPGTYPITVTTTWNGVSTTATVILNVSAKSPGSFTLSTPPPGFNTLMVGGSTTFAITSAVSGGFSAPVTCTASNVPTGVNINFSPSPIPAPGSGTCTANITALATAPTGSHTITVTGVGGGDTSSTTFSLILESFSLTASPVALSVSRGSSGTSTIALNMTPAPNDSTVTPVATGQPAGVTVSFNPTYLAPTTGTSAMTVTVPSGTTPGTYAITVTATWNGVPETTTVTLTVL